MNDENPEQRDTRAYYMHLHWVGGFRVFVVRYRKR